MKISAKSEYACVAMMDLAARYASAEPVQVGKIAERHSVPPRFLVQILLQLKASGLVASTRGAAGGYQLVRPPDEISLADILSVMEGPAETALSTTHGSGTASVLIEALSEATRAEQDVLSSTTLADLVARAPLDALPMYHI